uniref:WASH complex subunit 7 n=1 Tax=Syphacia muris TaxID=451379 RepID=A0A0N5AK55_9BILA
MEKEDKAGLVELRRFAKLLNQLPSPDFKSISRCNRRVCFIQNKQWEGEIIVGLAQSGSTTIDKCIMTFSSLIVEVNWLYDTAHSSLFLGLLLYGEDVHKHLEKEGGSIRMMAEFLPFLQDISVFVSRCYEVFRNIVLQIYSFYLIRESLLERVSDRKLLQLWKALGDLLSILIFMDEIIQRHPVLKTHWNLLLKSLQSAQHNPSRFDADKPLLKPLMNVIHQIDAQLMTGFIFRNCCQQSFHDALYTDGRFSDNLRCIISEIYGTWEQISSNDIADKRQLVVIIALLSFLCQTFSLVDKRLVRNIWNSHKRLAAFHIIGDIIWTPCEFLLKNIPEIEKVIDKKQVSSIFGIRSLLISQQALLLAQEVSKNMHLLVEWRVKMDEELREWPQNNVYGRLMHRINLFFKGMRQADLLSRTVRLVLCGSLHENRPLSRSTAIACIRFIEIIKEIEFLFKKWWDEIIESIQQALQHWSGQLLRLVDAVKKSAREQAHVSKNKVDIIAALAVVEASLCGSVSVERLAVIGVALELACYTKIFRAEDQEMCTNALIRMETLLSLQQTLSRLCDCSFLFWNRALISTYFDSLVKDAAPHIQVFFAALLDVQSMLDVCRHTSVDAIKGKFRDEIYTDFEKRFLVKVAEAVETDLRFSTHSYLHNVEDELSKCPVQQKTFRLKSLLQLPSIYLCGQFIDVRRYTELYLERAFYNLTAVALDDCSSYRQMRQLAMEKYGLHLCDSHLPFHALDQGLDVLLISRNLEAFVSNYNYNLNGQFFIENDSKNKHLNILAVEHVANSIRTHGTGIMNTVINFAYQYLKKKFFVFSQFLYDDHIRGQLVKEIRHFYAFADQTGKMYSVKRAQRFNASVKDLGVSDEGYSFLDKFRVLITHIGNVMGYIRIVRSGSIEATSLSLSLLPNFEEVTPFSSIVSECSQCSAKTIETAKFLDQIFEETREHLNRTNNYLQILVEVFSKELRNFEKYDHLANFYIIIPALTVNYIEHILACKGTLGRRAQQNNVFTDDGFVLGIAFILVTLDQLSKFNSLNWFSSVEKTCKEEISNVKGSDFSTKANVEPSVKLRIAKLELYRKFG